jgi:predicted ATPase
MPISDEIRRLDKKWRGDSAWPRRLEWVEPKGIRGWDGQRISFPFPIVAIVGENGSGKSTLLQSAACSYQGEEGGRTWFPTEFFPTTAWDQVLNPEIRFGYHQAGKSETGTLRKLSRWLGQTDRPRRRVEYVDLNRIQPVGARVGYARIAKTKHSQKSATNFEESKVQRFSSVMGRRYESARMALSNVDDEREIPVVSRHGTEYSGYHQGSGEITIMELLKKDLPKYGLLLIDEIESSLHPRSQRRLIRELAEQCRTQEAQVILTTHSPYILDELPLHARMYILETKGVKKVISGISPEFAMTKMDDDLHPEADIYVEDVAAQIMIEEILAIHGPDVFIRCAVVPYGAANVGFSLGQMVEKQLFRRPTVVFIDGDNAANPPGCVLLPGADAPEQVVFKALRARSWGDVWSRIGRDTSSVEDACNNAMTLNDHHEWVRVAANHLRCGGDNLWRAMCTEWAKSLPAHEAQTVVRPIIDVLP